MDENGNLVDIDGNPATGTTIDWWMDKDMVPNLPDGASGISKVRWESIYDKTEANNHFPGHTNYIFTLNQDLRIKETATGYGSQNYLPTYMTSRKTSGPGRDFDTWTTDVSSLDPESADFGYSSYYADRNILVPSSHSIQKQTDPKGLKVIRG